MTTPKRSFKEFNLKPQSRAFSGEKIGLQRILNAEITVLDCKVVPSNKNAGDCLHMQIEYKGETWVVFTGASALIDVAQRFPEDAYPFTTTIEKRNERYEFT